MTSQKPYLVRAIYEWLLDNQLTPYLLVNTRHPDVQVPTEYIVDNRIVLNVAPDAVRQFHADNELIRFSARFSGKSMDLFIPIHAILAIYGKENNEGMFFTEDEPTPPAPEPTEHKSRPSLKVVK